MADNRLSFVVPKLACSACVETVTAAIQTRDPQAIVAADPKTKQVEIELSDAGLAGRVQPEAFVREILTAAGYPPN